MSKTVLLAEDHEDNRLALQLMLEHAGYRTLGAKDGREAVELARQHVPDLIMMDLSMPVLDGREATRELKCDPRTRGIPVVMLTAMALSVDPDEASHDGFAGVLFKPVLPANLVADVRERIGPPDSPPAPSADL
jgi:two-component system cell cycle response regulator DivK